MAGKELPGAPQRCGITVMKMKYEHAFATLLIRTAAFQAFACHRDNAPL
jgi:hypothetical protein